jgi:hypothetical protein
MPALEWFIGTHKLMGFVFTLKDLAFSEQLAHFLLNSTHKRFFAFI